MRKEMEQQIISLAPYMFEGYRKSPQESCLAFGFEIGEGWFNLLKNLINEIIIIDKNKNLVVDQVKEKYGALRFYYHTMGKCDDKKIDKKISKYERISINTCELCGKKGRRNRTGWLTTLCNTCRKERDR